MLQSVLETDSMFGVIKWDPNTKSMANIGGCAQIIKHQTAEDGRSNIITLGQQRFQVLEIIRSTPFCSAMVSWISDDNVDNIQKLDSLKDSVTEALGDVINLTSKLTNTFHRLEREYELLDHTRRQLAARTALKDTFSNADQANN